MLSVFTLLASSFGVGQDSTSKVQIFGGSSLLHTDNSGLNGPALDAFFGTPTGTFGVASNFSGWDTQIQFNANRTLGIVADLGVTTATCLPRPALAELLDYQQHTLTHFCLVQSSRPIPAKPRHSYTRCLASTA
jgi:hypothetical protein